jgi:transcriptional regulator GlxA family with amidase domain
MKVGVALYNKTLLTSLTLATEMLHSAHRLWPRVKQRNDPLSIEVVGPQQVTMMGGIAPKVDIGYEQFNQYDIIILPPMWGNPLTSIKQHPQILTWLTKQYRGGARVIATGTGVCWLAETGLLDGQVATTHWYYYDKFAKRYPKIQLNPNATTTRTSGIYCTRSINSQTELIVYLISRYFGTDIAKVIEKHYMHEVSKVSEEPYYEIGGGLQYDEQVAIAQAYIKQHTQQQLTMEKIAAHCEISVRTLTRRFKNQVGETPHQYLLRVRMQQAKSLFLDLSFSIGEVAELVGFKDAHYFAKLFERQFEVSPKRYRQIVKSKTFTG